MPRWLLAVFLVLASCSRTQGSAPAADAGVRARLVPPPDQSLTPEAYERMGVPPSTRRWSGADLAQGVKALKQEVASKGPGILPRRGSPRSGEVFARLVSVDNLVPFGDHALPLMQRVESALEYFQATSEAMKLYLQAFTKRGVADSEMVDLMGALFRVAVAMQEPMLEFVATLDPNDPSYAARMDGIRTWKLGLAQMLGGGVITLSEQSFYRTEELVRLTEYMLETFPVLVPSLLPEGRTLIVERLGALAEDPKLEKELRSKVAAVHAKVKP